MDRCQRIRFAREQAGMNGSEAAKAFGVTRQTVSLWETVKCPDDVLPGLAALYGCEEGWLRGEETEDTVALVKQVEAVLRAGCVPEPTITALTQYAAALIGSRANVGEADIEEEQAA